MTHRQKLVALRDEIRGDGKQDQPTGPITREYIARLIDAILADWDEEEPDAK